jgi:hypothetical protein
MKIIYKLTKLLLISILSIALTFSACKKDDKFNAELIPGEYTGSIIYWTSNNGSFTGNSIPDLCKSPDYKTTITKSGSNYILLFDKSFVYTPPDINIEITSFENSQKAKFKILDGQAYSSIDILRNSADHNYFYITKYPSRLDCSLILKSNLPDSTYFLEFSLFRLY